MYCPLAIYLAEHSEHAVLSLMLAITWLGTLYQRLRKVFLHFTDTLGLEVELRSTAK